MQLDYDEIRRIYRLEKNTSSMVEVEDDFFDSLNKFMAEQKKDYLKSLKNFSTTKARDFTNIKKMVEEIFLLREKKLLNRALIASTVGEISENRVAREEKKTFKEMLAVLEKHKSCLNEIFEPMEKNPVKEEKKASVVKLKILKDVPSFVGTDMKEYGPFSEGQNVELPTKIASLLVSRKLAEK